MAHDTARDLQRFGILGEVSLGSGSIVNAHLLKGDEEATAITSGDARARARDIKARRDRDQEVKTPRSNKHAARNDDPHDPPRR